MMNESFSISISFNNKEIELEGEFRQLGFSYHLVVFVDGTEIIFEPDEERNLRAVIRDNEGKSRPPSRELIKVIADKLGEVFQ